MTFNRAMTFAMVYAFLMPLVVGWLAARPQTSSLVQTLGGETAAAWLQAVGSLMAIGVAIFLGRRQSADLRDAARAAWAQAKIDRIYPISVLARHALAQAQCAVPALDEDESGFVRSHFEAILESLSAVPLQDFGDEKLIGAVLDLQLAMKRLLWSFNAAESELENPDENSDPYRHSESLDQQVMAIADAREVIEDCLIPLIRHRDWQPSE